jgi:NADPH-dependent curcumin reductase CurA
VVALLTSGLTASLALEEVGQLHLPGSNGDSNSQPGDRKNAKKTVLVTAAAGGTGQFAVQLAKLAGCTVVATCGGQQKAGGRLAGDCNYAESEFYHKLERFQQRQKCWARFGYGINMLISREACSRQLLRSQLPDSSLMPGMPV